MERGGMKVNRNKTEYLYINEAEEGDRVSMEGRELKKMTEFKYLS